MTTEARNRRGHNPRQAGPRRDSSGHAQLRRKCDGYSPESLTTSLNGSNPRRDSRENEGNISMESNCPEAGHSKVSSVVLRDDRAFPNQLLVKKGSLKVQGDSATFTVTVLADDIESLYVAPADRLAVR